MILTHKQTFWYHYDIPNDFLYLRLLSERATESYAVETSDGRCQPQAR